MFNNGATAPQQHDKSPWARPGFIGAAAVVVLLVLLGLFLVVTGPGSDNPATDAPTPPPPAQATPPRDANASVCGLAAGSQAIPSAAPEATWKLRGTVAVPIARSTFGPNDYVSGIPSCFAHSPTGALFAVSNIYAALSLASHRSDDAQIAALKAMAAPGPGLDAATARRGGTRPSADSSSGVQIAGFNVVRYEPSSAVVDLAFRVDRSGVTGFVHATSTLRWQRGDWKIVLTQNGRPFDSMQQITDLSGYVPWSGV